MKKIVYLLVLVLVSPVMLWARDPNAVDHVNELLDVAFEEEQETGFGKASQSIQQQLRDSIAELNALREQVVNEKVPLSRKLSELEAQLVKVRQEYQETTRLLDSRTLDLSNLRNEIKSRNQEATYLSNLLGEYARNFESRLHISEIDRYQEALETAMLAPENSNLSEQEVYEAQANLISVSLDRLFEALGGTQFEGTAADESGSIHKGTFVLIGPAAVFKSDDGAIIGTAEQRLGSVEPAVISFANPEDTQAAAGVISDSKGLFPLDPTLGNAHKIEETEETFIEHIQKGGPVMYPIFGLAGAAFLVALYKWFFLSIVPKPSKKRINALLKAVASHDVQEVQKKAKTIKGPIGKMLSAGAQHIKEPRDLVEEVMYEKVLSTRLKLQRFLPFIAISASSAPLLGLLGTVTGIINTFKLITVFGSGDVKTLSGGISEALITTEFGLIVAIPSLLLHAFLSRKAKGIVDEMEKAAVAFINQISKTPYHQEPQMIAHRNIVREPIATPRYTKNMAGGVMDPRLVSIGKNATVAEAINKIRSSEIGEDIDTVFVVSDGGKYEGHVPLRHLLIRPEKTPVESLAQHKNLFVRVDANLDEVKKLISQHELINIPVLDHDDQLVGRISRNGNGDVK